MTDAPHHDAIGEHRKAGKQANAPEAAACVSVPLDSPEMTAFSRVHGCGPQNSTSVWSWPSRFMRFVGPGAIISVAYVDPDNYQTAISSCASFQYKLLFMVLFSNIIAIYLQSLCMKLGTVTGLDLAQLNHRHLPRWLELVVYAVAEACIICTDLGQVIGTAISLNILIPKLPLPAACVISVMETLWILLFYKPNGELRRIRSFEIFIAILVLALVVTICVTLAMISAPADKVFRGFLPSREIFVGDAIMPHAIYMGTALSRSRLQNFDEKHGVGPVCPAGLSVEVGTEVLYQPSLRAIRWCLSCSIAELCLTLFAVAVFVNSALIVISGASFYRPGGDVSEDIYSLYDLFSTVISRAAGILLVVSLLFFGVSAGIVATMAGAVVMEGALQIRLSPFVRRLTTGCVAVIPALIVAVAVGQQGLSQALVACNYVLSIGLVVVTFPLVYYTSRDQYMRVASEDGTTTVSLRNNRITAGVAYLIWTVVVFMNVATLVLIGLGRQDAA